MKNISTGMLQLNFRVEDRERAPRRYREYMGADKVNFSSRVISRSKSPQTNQRANSNQIIFPSAREEYTRKQNSLEALRTDSEEMKSQWLESRSNSLTNVLNNKENRYSENVLEPSTRQNKEPKRYNKIMEGLRYNMLKKAKDYIDINDQPSSQMTRRYLNSKLVFKKLIR